MATKTSTAKMKKSCGKVCVFCGTTSGKFRYITGAQVCTGCASTFDEILADMDGGTLEHGRGLSTKTPSPNPEISISFADGKLNVSAQAQFDIERHLNRG